MKKPTIGRAIMALLISALLAGAVTACGDDDEGGASSAGNETQAMDKAFLTGMLHHHMSAIEMAQIAQDRGQDPFVTGLADDIVATQESEIGQMEKIYERLFGGELKPDPKAHDGLGLTAEEAGMTHTPQTNVELKAANPFDRAFVDEMEPHHTGAVRMAQVVVKSTEDAEVRKLAEGIISTQEREIREMNSFRTQKYGGPVPDDAGQGGGSDDMPSH